MINIEAKARYVRFAPVILMFIAGMSGVVPGKAQTVGQPYPAMASIEHYLMNQDAEISLARSAGPESISKNAEVLVMDRNGYHVAMKGSNGFVCAVLRSWTAGPDDPNFWNPKLRGPICFTAAAAQSYLPRVFKRTSLALAGRSKEELARAMNAAFEAGELPAIQPGSMCYMLSKQGYLDDQAGHWHPHMMFYVPETAAESWGAGLPGSPVLASTDHVDRVTIFMIPVAKWSDGSPDAAAGASH